MTYTILHLIDTTGPGGAEDVFIALASELQTRGTKSVAVIRGEGYVAEQLRAHNIEPIILDSKGSFNIGFLWRLWKIIRREKVRLIQSHLLGSNVYAAIVGWLSRTPVVATYHGMVDVSPNERFKAAKLYFMRKGIQHFVAVSQSLKDAIVKHRLLVPARTSVVYNGIRFSDYTTHRDDALKNSLGLERQVPLLGTLGNIRKSKRYDLLLEATLILKQRNVKVSFSIAGDPSESLKSELDETVAKYALNNIHFVGFVKDSPSYLSNLDGFLLTSDAEGFSISTIEAMASGLPIIATKCGGPQEIIENENQGMLVDVSALAIANAIEDTVNDLASEAKPSLNCAARERVKQKFTLDVMVDEYLKIYSLLDSKIQQNNWKTQ